MGREEDEGNSCWTGLPEELRLAVLAFLDVPSLACFAVASRACYRLSLDSALWKGMCERDMAEWPCQQAFIRLASAALLAARRAEGEELDEGAGLWSRPFSWRAFYRCEARNPSPENRFFLRMPIGQKVLSFDDRTSVLYKAQESESERVVAARWVAIQEEQRDDRFGRQVVNVKDERKKKRIFEDKERLAARLMPATWGSKHLPSVFGLFWTPTSSSICLARQFAPKLLEEELDTAALDEARIASILRDVLNGLVDLQSALDEETVASINLTLSKLLVADEGHIMIEIDDLFSTCPKQFVPFYLSPEMAPAGTSTKADVNRTHIWAVGLIAIRLATGALPMEGLHPLRYLFRFWAEAPSELAGSFSPQLKDFVRCCLERQPQLRPAAHELLLHPFLAHAPPPTSPQLTPASSLTTTVT